jgi:hypothetical protein
MTLLAGRVLRMAYTRSNLDTMHWWIGTRQGRTKLNPAQTLLGILTGRNSGSKITPLNIFTSSGES